MSDDNSTPIEEKFDDYRFGLIKEMLELRSQRMAKDIYDELRDFIYGVAISIWNHVYDDANDRIHERVLYLARAAALSFRNNRDVPTRFVHGIDMENEIVKVVKERINYVLRWNPTEKLRIDSDGKIFKVE